MTTDNYCFYLENRLIQTSQTGGQHYCDTSPFSIPCPNLKIISRVFHQCATEVVSILNICLIFVQLVFNMSNGVTDTLETSSILIYLIRLVGIYGQKGTLIKTRVLIKRNTKRGI